MGRVLHVRIYGLDPAEQPALLRRFETLASTRQWRDDTPWLAHAGSRDLFAMEYFRHLTLEDGYRPGERPPLSAAGFVRLRGDETDALAMLFILRELSERFDVTVLLQDTENPIAKLRNVELHGGKLSGGQPVEDILVRRPLFKKLPDGFRIEMFPPYALRSAFGMSVLSKREERRWSFLLHGMRGSAPSFFEAEAEAMRIYRGLRFLTT